MKIKRFIGGMLESNGYVIYSEDGGSCFIIDPGYNGSVFTEYVKEHGLSPKGILLTHNHYDHVGAVERVKDELGCPVYMHRADCDDYKKNVDVYMEDGDVLDLDGEEIKIVSTPGHTKGSVCFVSEKSRAAFTEIPYSTWILEGLISKEALRLIWSAPYAILWTNGRTTSPYTRDTEMNAP